MFRYIVFAFETVSTASDMQASSAEIWPTVLIDYISNIGIILIMF